MIPLLSGKPLSEFTPESFKAHVRSLYLKPEKKASTKKPFIYRRTKTGKLSLKVNRDPKWLTQAELDLITKETGIPANEVFLKVKAIGAAVKK